MRFKAFSQQKPRSASGKKNQANSVGSSVALAPAALWKCFGATKNKRFFLRTMTSWILVRDWKAPFRSYWMNGAKTATSNNGAMHFPGKHTASLARQLGLSEVDERLLTQAAHPMTKRIWL